MVPEAADMLEAQYPLVSAAPQGAMDVQITTMSGVEQWDERATASPKLQRYPEAGKQLVREREHLEESESDNTTVIDEEFLCSKPDSV